MVNVFCAAAEAARLALSTTSPGRTIERWIVSPPVLACATIAEATDVSCSSSPVYRWRGE